MARYTIDSTAQGETGLAHAVALANDQIAAENVRRAAQRPPLAPLPLHTPTTYLAERVAGMLDSYARQANEAKQARRKAAIESASPAVRGQVDTLLGVS